MRTKRLYFIAVLPPSHIQEEVTAMKTHLAENYRASHALKSPPHITLISPLKASDKELSLVCEMIQVTAMEFSKFSINLNHFNAFTPRVIFVDVRQNNTLTELKNRLELLLYQNSIVKQLERREYHPHMTIAHRDLKKKYFFNAWKEYSIKEYNREFQVSSIVLLEHKNKRWEVLKEFPLTGV